MRTILTRSAVAVATLTIGSVALAAPATAAAPAGVTRDVVLSAAAGIQSDNPTGDQERALGLLVDRTCAIDYAAGERGPYYYSPRVLDSVGGGVSGVLVSAEVYNPNKEGSARYRECSFAALAATDTSSVMNGTVTLTATDPFDSEAHPPTAVLSTSSISGDVFVTPTSAESNYNRLRADASGSSVTTTTSTTSTQVKDTKSKAEKKAAKATYTKRLKSAKSSYEKALDKAGSSTSKKAAAKKAYSKKKASAKASYKKAISNVTTVPRTTSTTKVTPFDASASTYTSVD